jgi:hypothetical protein
LKECKKNSKENNSYSHNKCFLTAAAIHYNIVNPNFDLFLLRVPLFFPILTVENSITLEFVISTWKKRKGGENNTKGEQKKLPCFGSGWSLSESQIYEQQ